MSKTYLDKNGLTYFWSKVKSFINARTTPPGVISAFAGATAPTGWLMCDGSAVSRITYADLFAIIGTTYGNGDGTTTFNLPKYDGRVPVGLDTTDTSFDTLGETGGSKYLQEHQHAIYNNRRPNEGSIGGNGYFVDGGGNSKWGSTFTTYTENQGSGHSGNLQPYIVQNYIIKY